VLFPRAGGGTLAAQLSGAGWGATVIEVTVPEPPGDGPVGFATASDEGGGGDPTALIEFSDALVSCLGPRASGIAGRLNSFAPGTTLSVREPVPTLPGGVNIFHGGPVLSSVSATGGSEPDPPFTIIGLNLRAGDTVYLDNTASPTTFVDATHVRFRVPAIASGHKLLQIRRGYHGSNGAGFDVRATLATAPARRVMPDSAVTLTGTGFGTDIAATVDGLPARVYVIDTHRIEVTVTRPSRSPLESEKRGEPVTVEVFDRFVSLGSVPVLVAAFRIATFGDSIVWGQGLLPAQRFSRLVAGVISTRRNGRIAVFAADHCAHSGAVIGPISASEPPNASVPRSSTVFTGECPNTSASIDAQVNAWPARFPSELSEIDFVIVDGGINDVGVATILDPTGNDAVLAARTIGFCRSAMIPLLIKLLTTFPAARIVVTGYYPIVSSLSNIEFLIPLLAQIGLLAGLVTSLVPGIGPIGFGPIAAAAFKAWLQGRLSSRSAAFAATANSALADAVATATGAVTGRRVALAVPQFGAQNAIFAPDPFLFGVTPALGPEDPAASARLMACPTTPGFAAIPTRIASIGHPNTKGAQAYADAIASVLPALGL
jgi:hypothetical protein